MSGENDRLVHLQKKKPVTSYFLLKFMARLELHEALELRKMKRKRAGVNAQELLKTTRKDTEDVCKIDRFETESNAMDTQKLM